MPKKVTSTQLKKLQKAGATITKKIVAPKIDISTSSNDMKAAVLAAKAAVSIANNIANFTLESAKTNKTLMTKMVNILNSNSPIIGMDIIRDKDKLLKSVAFIRK